MSKRMVSVLAGVMLLILCSAQPTAAQEVCTHGFTVTVSNVHRPSVHEGTSVVVTTELATLTLYDVESERGQVSVGFVEGTTIVSVVVIPGPSGLHSINIQTDVEIECVIPPEPTPTEEPTATPTWTPTEEPTVAITATAIVTATVAPTTTVIVTTTMQPTATPTWVMTTPPQWPTATPTTGVTSTPPPRPTLTPTATANTATQEPAATATPDCEELLAPTGGAGQRWLWIMLLVIGAGLVLVGQRAR